MGKNYSVTPSKTSGKTYIRVSDSNFNELGFAEVKTGFIEVQPEKAENLMTMFETGELDVEFGPQNNLGLYEIKPIKVAVGAENLSVNA